MIRFVVAIWFTLHSLIGPGICCCTFQTDVSAAPQASADQPPTKGRKSCCCGTEGLQNQGAGGQRLGSNSDRPDPSSPSHDCPCKRSKEIAGMVSSPPAAAQMGEVVHDNFFAIVDVLPGAHGEVLRNCSASLQVQVHEPFWTTDDLLRVFHFMRC